jgi:hypothetical protein
MFLGKEEKSEVAYPLGLSQLYRLQYNSVIGSIHRGRGLEKLLEKDMLFVSNSGEFARLIFFQEKTFSVVLPSILVFSIE